MSGAFSTRQGAKNNVFKGDIFTEHPAYREVVIECKTTKKKITVTDLYNPKSKFWEWIRQTKREAGSNPWILIYRDGTRKTYIAIERHTDLAGLIAEDYYLDGAISVRAKIKIYKMKK